MIKYYKLAIVTGKEEALGHIFLSVDSRVQIETDRSFSITVRTRQYNIYADTVEVCWCDVGYNFRQNISFQNPNCQNPS